VAAFGRAKSERFGTSGSSHEVQVSEGHNCEFGGLVAVAFLGR